MPTWGRGGAGNIVTESQIEETQRRLAEDLEASKSLTSSAAPPATSDPPSHTTPQEYAHMGRGGAGNWYQPAELSSTGAFSTPSDATAPPPSTSKPQISTPYHPPGMELPVARAGRGGAGNFVWTSEEEKKAREEAEREREREVAERVVQDVEKGLARPGRAVLGQAKGGRGW